MFQYAHSSRRCHFEKVIDAHLGEAGMSNSNNPQENDGPARPSSQTADDYNALPYPSLPVEHCQPSALAAMAAIFGVEPPRLAGARVLELGCSSGGNIIPLAARFPQSSFVGIDLAHSHVDLARRHIAELQLGNVSVEVADLATAKFEPQSFDFILCHGVFSWVPVAVQDAIFRICANSLSPRGIASISFNVLPGWHMRRIVRDICRIHAGSQGTPLQRATRARTALEEITNGLTGTDPYTLVLRNEAKRIRTKPLAYVLGEFLSENNTPVYFSEFRTRAEAAGLAYLSDGELATSLPEYFMPSAADKVRNLAMGRADALQHFMDVVSGRTFRRAVLVRNGRVADATFPVDPMRMRGLHFSAELTQGQAGADGGAVGFKDARGRRLSPKDPRATSMLTRLTNVFPSTQTVDELLGDDSRNQQLVASVLKTLLGMIGRQQATAFALPLKVGRDVTVRPRAWSVARLDAVSAQPWVTSLHHRAVRLSPALAVLLPMMDGTRDHAALRDALSTVMAQGGFKAKATQRLKGSNGTAASLDVELAATLAYCSRNGLLEV